MLEQHLQATLDIEALAEEGLQAFADRPERLDRLEELKRFHAFFQMRLRRMLEDWDALRDSS